MRKVTDRYPYADYGLIIVYCEFQSVLGVIVNFFGAAICSVCIVMCVLGLKENIEYLIRGEKKFSIFSLTRSNMIPILIRCQLSPLSRLRPIDSRKWRICNCKIQYGRVHPEVYFSSNSNWSHTVNSWGHPINLNGSFFSWNCKEYRDRPDIRKYHPLCHGHRLGFDMFLLLPWAGCTLRLLHDQVVQLWSRNLHDRKSFRNDSEHRPWSLRLRRSWSATANESQS